MTAGTITVGWTARAYPTREQAARLNAWAGSLRFLWNRLLERETAEHAATGHFLWRKQLQPIAVGMKREAGLGWLADLPAHAVLDTAARLDKALATMIAMRKRGVRWGFPKPKKKFVREAGIYLVGQATHFADDGCSAKVPKLGRLKIRGGRMPAGEPICARISRDGDRWMISAQFRCARPDALPTTGVNVGIDLGLTTLATIFDGSEVEKVEPPKPLRKALKRLRRLERSKSRRRKGSARRRAQARQVGTLHRRIRNQRKDFLHQLSHRLTAKADGLTVETLDIRAMARGLRLGRSVADAGMGMLLRFIGHKADWRGRDLHAVDRWRPSTRPCCACGVLHDMPLAKCTLRCACGNVVDRDQNAARNLWRYGQEARNLPLTGRTRGDIGEQAVGFARPPVPVAESRMLAEVA